MRPRRKCATSTRGSRRGLPTDSRPARRKTSASASGRWCSPSSATRAIPATSTCRRINWLTIQVGNYSGRPTPAQVQWIATYSADVDRYIRQLDDFKQSVKIE